jgi:hypothetical protein
VSIVFSTRNYQEITLIKLFHTFTVIVSSAVAEYDIKQWETIYFDCTGLLKPFS